MSKETARVWDAKTGRHTDWIRDELNRWEQDGFTLHSIVPWGNGDMLMVASKPLERPRVPPPPTPMPGNGRIRHFP